MTATMRTPEEALERFRLVSGQGDEAANEACVMTLYSWMLGLPWGDHLECAHPLLNKWVILAQDRTGATHEQRAEIFRAGLTGVLGTWWVPTETVLAAYASAPGDLDATKMVAIADYVAAWKAAESKQRANLVGADLGGADLRNADLVDADLVGANLVGAYYTQLTTWPANVDPKARGAVLL